MTPTLPSSKQYLQLNRWLPGTSRILRSVLRPANVALVLMLLGSVAVHAERLFVVHVKGEVYNNGLPIRVGSEIDYRDDLALQYSSIFDEVIVVNPEKGRYIISARKYKLADGMIRVPVRDNLLPCAILRPTPKRSSDLKDVLGDGRLSLLDSIVLPIDRNYLLDHPNEYFFITYKYEGEKLKRTITIDPVDPSLTISNKLFATSREYIDPSMAEDIQLYLYDAAKDQAKKLSNLKITSLLSESIVQELRVLVNGMRTYTDNDPTLLLQEVRSHIEEFYGQVRDTTVERYLRMLAGG